MKILQIINEIIENICYTVIVIATLMFTLVICNPLAWVGLLIIYSIMKG